MKIVFRDTFETADDRQYPPNWAADTTCGHPNRLGWVEGGRFHLLHPGTYHGPLVPPLRDFELEVLCRGDRFFSPVGIEVYFRFDRRRRAGYCLRYEWGVASGRTHAAQLEMPVYRAVFGRYDGRKPAGRFAPLAAAEIPGFCADLSAPQRLRLEVRGDTARWFHDGRPVGEFRDPDDAFPGPGALAFDRLPGAAAFSLERVEVRSDEPVPETPLLPERSAEFPAWVNGILSPYRFHVALAESAGRWLLRTRLTGGPKTEPDTSDVDRYRFHERMIGPYIRLETEAGAPLGTFRMFRGSVGLGPYHWNRLATIQMPADAECPLARTFLLEPAAGIPRVFLGYARYEADDTLGQAGGPSEALLDDTGRVLFAGAPLLPGSVHFDLESPPDKAVCARIPTDIPHYDEALAFAQANHYFFEDEQPHLAAVLRRRAPAGGDPAPASWTVRVTLENAFREPLGEPSDYGLALAPDGTLPAALRVDAGRTAFFQFPRLGVGVYHARAELLEDGLPRAAVRRAFEVMADDPRARPAPAASGLPRLYINILSGPRSEHFFPWGRAVVDTAHYSTGGNNFFKIARAWRPWDLLRVYGRQWLCWTGLWRTPGAADEVEANADLIAASDAARTARWRSDLWIRAQYRQPPIRAALQEFLGQAGFRPAPGGCLTRAAVQANDPPGLTLEQFRELVAHHWKAWMLFFKDKVTGGTIPAESARIRTLAPACQPFSFCPVYPTYGSVYKAGYFPLYFGVDLRAGLAAQYPGPNGFEDYPYSSGYPIARGVYQLASCKLEDPDLTLYPEMFGVNGETADAIVVRAHPPYGRSDPPRGLLTKQFFEYAFGVCWFGRDGFHYWTDHGFYPKTWSRDNYEELLRAYAFIARVRPVRPLRTAAFVFSRNACLAHPDHYDHDDEQFGEGGVFNTAEEAPAFAYEMARADGQLAGFVARIEDLDALSPQDAHTLVLPPLGGLDEAGRRAIRRLHEQGVSLLGFEDAGGLEDLFGVRLAPSATPVTAIAAEPGGPLADLAPLRETSAHPLCVCRHAAAGAAPLLTGSDGVPVLLSHRTPWGQTAFFTVPPTVVRRARARVPQYGQESISELINRATARILRMLGQPAVETTEGKVLAFWDDRGAAHVIVAEDAWPRAGGPIRPRVTVRLPFAGAAAVSADVPYAVAARADGSLALRLALATHQAARLRLAPPDKRAQ